MKLRNLKIWICMLFMGIFVVKMLISVAPAFLCLNSKTVHAAIMQLEQETKNEKEDPDKDAFKEKKSFDEDLYCFDFEHVHFTQEINRLHNLEKSLYQQVYHPVVPTPPPNA
ncbi:hypothetical protein MUY27_18480 [Mucilaginibacter sp. RS28]|uniref:Uncharacterized protein n=1 Tax=Mucilaginibacter straminoryzae TaxID=2932774 RepID=A0A9X2BD51_9SPHI|nr:hypothetical protein [Mucilaginibacter straminoryzae]MCJ8211712.1 hypothetical protein [Mucilaginibacter straminoryzae]